MRRQSKWNVFVYVAVTILLDAVLGVLYPLPGGIWALLPLMVLNSFSAGAFSETAATVIHYLRADFSPAVVASLLLQILLTGLVAFGVPTISTLFIVYTSTFYAISAVLRTAFETTSLVFEEESQTSKKVYTAFAISRITYFAAVPILVLPLSDVAQGPKILVLVFLFATLVVWSRTDRPLFSYLVGGSDIESEIRVLQALRRRPLSELDLAASLNISAQDCAELAADLIGRHLLSRQEGLIDVRKTYRRVLNRHDQKKRRQRKIERQRAKAAAKKKR